MVSDKDQPRGTHTFGPLDGKFLSPNPDHSPQVEVRMFGIRATQGISEKNGPPLVPDP